MRTVIRVVQLQKLIQKRLHLPFGKAHVSLHRRLAGHGRQLFRDHGGRPSGRLLRQLVQKLLQKILFAVSVQIAGHGAHRCGISAEILDLKAHSGKIFPVFLQRVRFQGGQIQDQRRRKILAVRFPFLQLFHKSLILHLFMSRMLVDDEKAVLILHQPVGIENLSDDPVLLRRLFA